MGKWSAGLHPQFIAKLDELDGLCVAEGLGPLKETSGARGFRKQALMYVAYKQSPSVAYQRYGVVAKPAPPGLSRHHPFFNGKAAAVDAVFDVQGLTKEEKRKRHERAGELAESIGLRWGGRWGDPVHFEIVTIDGRRVDVFDECVSVCAQLDRLIGFVDDV